MQQLEHENFEKLKRTVAFIHLYMSMPLYLLFWFADLLFLAEKSWICLAVRALIVPLSLSIFALNNRIRTFRGLEWLTVLSAAGHALIITILILFDGGFISGYYAGLNLVTIAAISFAPVTMRFRLIIIASIFFPYYLLCTALGGAGQTYLKGVLFSSFFIFGTVVISLLISYFNDELRLREFEARQKLEEEIAGRDLVIKSQTDANVHFQLLSRQFSPQVIKAMKVGKSPDFKAIQRQKICVIFVDIDGSTSRIVRLDKDDVATVISMFMDDVMSILLKYDITIDKFLGDGVLAFSNHPVNSDDYVERMVDAAIEIRARIIQRRDNYLEFWKNEMRVTIGIDVGYANVGIYGNDKVLQTYTAIGEVVNLAKRLSSEATPNQIMISQSAVKLLPAGCYQITPLGERIFKGFEADIIPVYEITKRNVTHVETGIDLCPQDRSVLHLARNNMGIYVLTCRECGYVMPEDHTHRQKSAAA